LNYSLWFSPHVLFINCLSRKKNKTNEKRATSGPVILFCLEF